MARTHRISPLPELHLRSIAELLRELADVYDGAADQLKAMERKSLPVEKFAYLRDGLDYLITHAEQAVDWPTREKLWKLYEGFRVEPLPAESYDRTKGKPDPKVEGASMADEITVGGGQDLPGKQYPTPRKKKKK